jgi:hypothetical protein
MRVPVFLVRKGSEHDKYGHLFRYFISVRTWHGLAVARFSGISRFLHCRVLSVR